MNETLEILNSLIQLDKLDKSPERKNMEGQAEALRRRLPQPVLAYYDRCRARGRKPVAVMIGDGVCRGCHMRVSRGLLSALQRGDEIQVCEHCGAYLLWTAVPSNVSELQRP